MMITSHFILDNHRCVKRFYPFHLFGSFKRGLIQVPFHELVDVNNKHLHTFLIVAKINDKCLCHINLTIW